MNPITDTGAAQFLAFYAVVIQVVHGARAWWINRADRTLDSPWTPPATVDAYEVAHLRSGMPNLACVAVVSLAERGFLELRADALVQAGSHPDLATLTALEGRVFDFFGEERRLRTLAADAAFVTTVNTDALRYEEWLQSQKLLAPETVICTARRTAFLTTAIIGVVGLPGLLATVGLCWPVSWFIMLGGIGLAVTWKDPGRLSRRGKSYLDSLQRASASEETANPLSMATALFGASALTGSPYEPLRDLYETRKTSDTSGCGTGDCDGGGCGGCGGCGG